MKEILRVLVGSRAHQTHGPDSDYDYKGIYAIPTSELLTIEHNANPPKGSQLIDGKKDDINFEIGKFLAMARKSNPTILEVFWAPRIAAFSAGDPWYKLGSELRDLFPYTWSSIGVKNAFIGYGLEQQKKMLDRRDKRSTKHAIAYLRILYQGYMLLSTGVLPVSMLNSPIWDTILEWKPMEMPPIGEVIDLCMSWQNKLRAAYDENPDKQTNMEPLNEFLLKVRKGYWDDESINFT